MMQQTPTQKILEACKESQTLNGIHKITGYSWQRIAKTLSTEGIVVNETQALIIDLHYRGKSAGEISAITGFAMSTVMAYLPRVRSPYLENRSENAMRIEKYRRRKESR